MPFYRVTGVDKLMQIVFILFLCRKCYCVGGLKPLPYANVTMLIFVQRRMLFWVLLSLCHYDEYIYADFYTVNFTDYEEILLNKLARKV